MPIPPTWLKRQDIWVNQSNICAMTVSSDGQGNWFIQYTFNGGNWLNDFQIFASRAAAQTFLDNYATGLG